MPTLTQAEYVSLKSKLTKAINSKDDKRIVKTCDEAFAVFDEKGYPDRWHLWEVARDDANQRIRLAEGSW